MLNASIIITTSNNEAIIKTVAKSLAEKIVFIISDLISKESEPKGAIVSTSLADGLRKLAELKKEGILSDEEFQVQKAKLIA